jgi:integrase
MITPRVFKQKGSRVYRGRFKLTGDLKVRDIALNTPYRHVAEANLRRIVREMEEEASGLVTPKPLREAAQKPLGEHLEAFMADISARGRCKKHLQHTRNRLIRLFEAMGWRRLCDITADGFARWRSEQVALSAKTRNEYLGHATALLNWCVRNGRLGLNPLATVGKVETRGHEKVIRRALSQEQLQALINVSGPRSLAYWLASWTGLRRGELKTLSWADLQLDIAKPCIRVRSSTTKNKRAAVLPLLHPLPEALRAFRDAQPIATGKVFRRGVPTTKMLVRDLAAAGIPEYDELGRRIDFHALRHTFSSLLANAGVAQRVAMELMRHSDPRLTANTYTDVTALPLFSEIEKLQRILPSPIASLNSDHGGVNLSTAGQSVHAEIAPAVAEVVQIDGICPELSAVGQDWAKAEWRRGGDSNPR